MLYHRDDERYYNILYYMIHVCRVPPTYKYIILYIYCSIFSAKPLRGRKPALIHIVDHMIHCRGDRYMYIMYKYTI